MEQSAPAGVDPAAVRRIVGDASYGRAVAYVRQHAVIRALWKPEAHVLVGNVHGSGDKVYTATARFVALGNTDLFEGGECSCPVGIDCKHVAALVLSTQGGDRNGSRGGPATGGTPSWDSYLGSLLGEAEGGEGQTPLAIELALTTVNRWTNARGGPQPTPTLTARLVRPGRRGGWIHGNLSWSSLDTLRYQGDYDDRQLRALQELYAMYRTGAASRFGAYRDEKTIDLSTFPSRQLWRLLDDARAADVRMVYERGKLGVVPDHGRAELCLDVTRPDAAPDSTPGCTPDSAPLTVTPLVRVDEPDIDPVPLCFIGSGGYGIVYVDRDARAAAPHTAPFRLAELDRPASQALQRMTLEHKMLRIPAADAGRFRNEFYPQLRHLATVISTDDSFRPPEISAPTLVVRAEYGEGHDLDLGFQWWYQVGETALREPLVPDGPAAGFRDLEAERAVIEGLTAPLERFGLRCATTASPTPEQALVPHVRVTGLDTMRVTTELLPLLDDAPSTVVEIVGTPADYRAADDSVSIGVSTEQGDVERDWFDLDVTVTVEGRQVPFETLFSALARGHEYLMMPDGAYFSLQKPELLSLRRLIEEARALQESPPGQLKISRFQAGLWEELAALGVVEHQAAAWQRQVQGLLSLGSLDTPPTPQELAAQLRPYQKDGFGWLAFLFQNQLGGVLADDMGLGKTLQTLALISHSKRDDARRAPFLVVAPASVVGNWVTQARRFAPDLTIRAVRETVQRSGTPLAETATGADAVIASYTLFRIDFEHYEQQTWSGLIMDEAQFAKNHQSKVYRCARELPAPFKLAITGTPMENNLMELWSMLSITAPGLFPSPTRFREYYARPIERREDPALLAQLRRRIRPLVKRRTKEQVATELPAKQEQVLEVELHHRHRQLYQRYLQRERQKVLGLLDDLGRNRFTILRSLTLLRRLSLHAGLVDPEHANLPCAKIDELFEQLGDVIGSGHRALIFSQFTGFLGQVCARLDTEGIEYCYLDGSTRKRDNVIERFKSGTAPLFLISLKAGGFGLNLTEADYCFLLDPWWNPASERQAVDRTHRIGQVRNVVVYRLIAKDTIEEKVLALQQRKAELFASVMDSGDVFSSALGADDIRELLRD